MPRRLLPHLLLLAGLTLVPAAPLCANDFYPMPPVPSSRKASQTPKTRSARPSKFSKAINTSPYKRKIVKNITTGNSGGNASRPKASLQ